jgi:Galactokinase
MLVIMQHFYCSINQDLPIFSTLFERKSPLRSGVNPVNSQCKKTTIKDTMTTQELKTSFENLYQASAEAIYFSPGRVNLIGEHTEHLTVPVSATTSTWWIWPRHT